MTEHKDSFFKEGAILGTLMVGVAALGVMSFKEY